MKTLNNLSTKKSAGLTLIEVLVTIAITSIGLMGLLSLQMQALKATQDAGNYSHATWILNDLASRIRANRNASLSYTTAINCPTDSTKVLPAIVCSNYATGSSRAGSAACTGPELAAWDVFEVSCGMPRDNININGNPIDALPSNPGSPQGPILSVTCVDLGCTNGDPLMLRLTWSARMDATEASGAIRQAGDNRLTASRMVRP